MNLESTNKKPIIYLASPYGFSIQAKFKLIPEFVQKLEALGLEVWEPFERNQNMDLSKAGSAYKVAINDIEDIKNSDAIFAIVNGNPQTKEL